MSQVCRCAHVRRVAAPLGHETSLYRNTAPYRMQCRARTAPYRGSSCAVSQPVSLPLLRHKCRPKQRYNLCIVTLSATQATRARALGHIARTALRIVAHARSCRGRALAVLWPIPCAPMPAVSRYSLLDKTCGLKSLLHETVSNLSLFLIIINYFLEISNYENGAPPNI